MVDTGVVGGALSDIGLGLMRGMMGPSWEEEKQARALKFEKEREDVARIRSQTKLDEARALYESKRGGVPDYLETNWGLYLKNPETNKLEMVHQKPDAAAKELEVLRANARRNMEQVIGRKRGVASVPMHEFTPEEMTDSSISRLMDIYRGRSEFLTSPGGTGGIIRRDDPALQSPGGQPQPPAQPTTGTGQQATTGGGQQPAKAVAAPKAAAVTPGAVLLGKPTPEMEDAIAEAHRLYPQVRPELIRAIAGRESSYNPYARSGKGAEGVMQLMPATGREMGVTDPFDVKQNIIGGTRYLAQQLEKYGGSEGMALAAYNAGPGRFDKGSRTLAQMPPETQAYVPAVLQRSYQMRWGQMAQPDVDQQWQVLNASKTARPEDKDAARQAYKAIFGKEPPDISGAATTPAAVAPVPPSTATGTAKPVTPPSPEPAKPATPAAKPEPPAGTSGEPTPRLIQTAAQQEEVLRRKANDEREAERLRLQQQGLSNQEQEARLRELDRKEHTRRWEAEQKLREDKAARDIQELADANKRKDEAAAFRVTQNIMRETREARGMIQGVDETVALIQEMRRYISPETVGVKGAVRGTWQSLWGQLTDATANTKQAGGAAALQREVMATAGAHQREADTFGGTWQMEENERAKAEGRTPSKIYIPDYSKYGYDPRMRFIDFLKEVIAYSHARAMNGPGRLTDQDLNRAQKSLGIDGWMNSAADMQTSLGYVEKQLKAKKERAQAYAKSVEGQLRKHRPGALEAGADDVPSPAEE